jgi:hypothetical protein
MHKREWTVEALAWLSIAFAVVVITLFLTACRTVRETTADSRQTEHLAGSVQTVRDSVTVYRLDSVFVRETGDTVYIDRLRMEYRDRLRTDTLTVTDTVRVERVVTVKETVENNQSFRYWLLIICLSAIIITISIRASRKS